MCHILKGFVLYFSHISKKFSRLCFHAHSLELLISFGCCNLLTHNTSTVKSFAYIKYVYVLEQPSFFVRLLVLSRIYSKFEYKIEYLILRLKEKILIIVFPERIIKRHRIILKLIIILIANRIRSRIEKNEANYFINNIDDDSSGIRISVCIKSTMPVLYPSYHLGLNYLNFVQGGVSME